MNRDFTINYSYNFKYRLLVCTMLNYYRKHYATNQFNGKILILASDRRELMSLYDYMFSVIRHFTKEDISTLKLFMKSNDKLEKELYNKIVTKAIDFQELLNGIKKEYTEEKSTFIEPKRNTLVSTPLESSIIFMEYDKARYIKEKHQVKEILIGDRVELDSSICKSVISALENFIKVTTNNINEGELSKLNIFIESESSGLDIWDQILDDLRDETVDE